MRQSRNFKFEDLKITRYPTIQIVNYQLSIVNYQLSCYLRLIIVNRLFSLTYKLVKNGSSHRADLGSATCARI